MAESSDTLHLGRISDPGQSTVFHNKNRDEIHRAFEARKSNPLTCLEMPTAALRAR